jgi:hypothetical protein
MSSFMMVGEGRKRSLVLSFDFAENQQPAAITNSTFELA